MPRTPKLMRLKRNNSAHENIQHTTDMDWGERKF